MQIFGSGGITSQNTNKEGFIQKKRHPTRELGSDIGIK